MTLKFGLGKKSNPKTQTRDFGRLVGIIVTVNRLKYESPNINNELEEI